MRLELEGEGDVPSVVLVREAVAWQGVSDEGQMEAQGNDDNHHCLPLTPSPQVLGHGDQHLGPPLRMVWRSHQSHYHYFLGQSPL